MRALSTLCKSLLICFTSSTVKSTHFLLISAPLKMGEGGFHSRRNCPHQSPFSKVDRGVFLKSYLRAKPDHRGRKNERRSCFALAPSLDRPPRRVDLFQRSEEPKTACQRKPTARLALSSTERRDLQPRAHLRSPRRPRPCHPRPQQGRNSYSTQLRLTGSARWRYISAQKKGGLKFLSIAIASTTNDGCDACARAMVSICSIPNDLSGDNKLEGCGRIGSAERGVACVA